MYLLTGPSNFNFHLSELNFYLPLGNWIWVLSSNIVCGLLTTAYPLCFRSTPLSAASAPGKRLSNMKFAIIGRLTLSKVRLIFFTSLQYLHTT